MRFLNALKDRARQLQTELHTIYLAYKDPRTPLHAKILIACVIGYAFSPIDLIPDFIPVLGYLDDFILVPMGIALALGMIPPAVLAECREKARAAGDQRNPRNWIAASVIVALWLLFASLAFLLLSRYFRRER
jgi:uncharacterized membrane protein YkvA (DUF1232 family)